MKATKFLLFTLLIFLACAEENSKLFNADDNSFVRFFLLVNSNNDVIEYPVVEGGLQPVSTYIKDDLRVLKIPVALTSLNENEVEVNFATKISNLNGVEISPQNKITFTKSKKIDTIFVTFTERWDISKNPKIEFELTQVSDASINIGMPNTNTLYNKLTVDFAALNFTYKIANPNNQEVLGDINESRIINIDFPKGFIPSEIANTDLLLETQSNFEYTLQQLPILKNNQISYVFTVDENIKIDELEFQTKFKLNTIPNYQISGLETATIKKEIVIDRDNTVNTASQFYNLSDPFNRIYGENWLDFNADDICKWETFNTFTYPVVVDQNHPNAVLFDDNGTPNTDDDIYHHAFRIGFNSTLAGRTTNSLNLKRWFTNESTNSSNSPGFNISEALEFFPLNGNSKTEGFVKVIENDLQIKGRNGNTYIISIAGNGTYRQISAGLIEIDLALEATNNALFGGTRIDKYKMYNQQSYPDPNPITDDCKKPIEL